MYNILSAKEIKKKFRNALMKDVSLQAIHHIADKLGYKQKHIGGKIGYDKSVYTALTRHLNELMEYDKAMNVKHSQKALKQPIEGDYYMYNGERDNRDYAWESVMNRYIMEAIDELDLYHGSRADFNEFDLAYISSGWGQQAYGYGVYLIDNPQGAKEYARGNGGIIYTAKVPNGTYLSYAKISRMVAHRIARDFYHYYLKNNEYGKEAYKGHEKEFWEYECKYICDSKNGGDVYGTISSILGSDKETSEFLRSIGYKGIKWLDITADGSKNTNYVIFNPKDIKILKKEKLGESKVLQGDLFSGEFSDEPIKRWKKENDKKKAAERRRQAYKEKKEEENKRKRIEQYNNDSKRMKNGGLFRKEDFK